MNWNLFLLLDHSRQESNIHTDIPNRRNYFVGSLVFIRSLLHHSTHLNLLRLRASGSARLNIFCWTLCWVPSPKSQLLAVFDFWLSVPNHDRVGIHQKKNCRSKGHIRFSRPRFVLSESPRLDSSRPNQNVKSAPMACSPASNPGAFTKTAGKPTGAKYPSTYTARTIRHLQPDDRKTAQDYNKPESQKPWGFCGFSPTIPTSYNRNNGLVSNQKGAMPDRLQRSCESANDELQRRDHWHRLPCSRH